MTLPSESVCGSQSPTLHKAPTGSDIDYALADDVLLWVESIGISLFPWQRAVLRQSLARRGNRWAAYEVDLVVPRQNGKNEILIALELAAVAVLGKRLVVHSAHEASTSQKHFKRFQELAERLPEFRKMLPATKTMGFYTSNGKEHIEFRNGATIDFRTRTKGGGRGFSSDLVVLDEAFNLTAQAVGSLMYTLRARRDPQIWKTSSAAHADSLVLHNDRRRAIGDDPDDSRLLYMEWGNDPDARLDDEATWLRSNPSVGMSAPEFSLELQDFRNEWRAAMGSDDLQAEFAREVCGIPEQPEGTDDGPISLERWDQLADADSMATDHSVRLALDVSVDRRFSTFAVAGFRHDRLGHVAVRDRRPGTDWVIERARELTDGHGVPVVIVTNSPASSFIESFESAGIPVDQMTPSEYAQACGRFIDATRGEQARLRHRGDPNLRSAVASVRVKDSGDGGMVWSRRSTKATDITPLTAATAAWGRVDRPAPSDAEYTGSFLSLSDF